MLGCVVASPRSYNLGMATWCLSMFTISPKTPGDFNLQVVFTILRCLPLRINLTAWSLVGHLKVGECTSPVRTRLYNIFYQTKKNGPHAGAWGSSNDEAATSGSQYVYPFGFGRSIVGVVS